MISAITNSRYWLGINAQSHRNNGTYPLLASACALALAAGLVVGRSPKIGLASSLVLLLALAAFLWPRAALTFGLLLMALPVTWSPSLGPVIVYPGVVVTGAFGLAGLLRLRHIQLHPLDAIVAGTILAPLVSAAAQGIPPQLFLETVMLVGIPYFGARFFLSGLSSPTLTNVQRSLVLTGVMVAAFGLFEELIKRNLTTSIFTNPVLALWTTEYQRAGLTRIQSTFGHPIALGMFLLIPLAFAFAARERLQSIALFIILPAEVLTFSRGPWLGVIVTFLLLTAVFFQLSRRKTHLIVFGAGIGTLALFFGPITSLLTESTQAGTVVENNAAYRLNLISTAFHHLTLLGNPLPQKETNLLLPGFNDLTSLVVLTILRTGLVGLLLWVAILVSSVRLMFRGYRSRDWRLYTSAVVVCAQWIGLLSVALITNYQFFFWFSVAYLASVSTDRHSPIDRTALRGSRFRQLTGPF